MAVKEVTPNERGASASFVQLDIERVHPKLFSPPPCKIKININKLIS